MHTRYALGTPIAYTHPCMICPIRATNYELQAVRRRVPVTMTAVFTINYYLELTPTRHAAARASSFALSYPSSMFAITSSVLRVSSTAASASQRPPAGPAPTPPAPAHPPLPRLLLLPPPGFGLRDPPPLRARAARPARLARPRPLLAPRCLLQTASGALAPRTRCPSKLLRPVGRRADAGSADDGGSSAADNKGGEGLR